MKSCAVLHICGAVVLLSSEKPASQSLENQNALQIPLAVLQQAALA
jgi:hypothetical protein